MTTQGIKRKLTAILSGLVVKADRMRNNLNLAEGLIMAERLMLRLSQKTGKKQIAYRIVNKAFLWKPLGFHRVLPPSFWFSAKWKE